jgi:hypothetical protein
MLTTGANLLIPTIAKLTNRTYRKFKLATNGHVASPETFSHTDQSDGRFQRKAAVSWFGRNVMWEWIFLEWSGNPPIFGGSQK